MIAAAALIIAVEVFVGNTEGAPIASATTTCNRGAPIAPEVVTAWRAGATGMATATTCPETMYDSILTVNGVAGEVACNDDVDSVRNCSTVTWAVTAGSQWAIGVSGYNGRMGAFTLHVEGPAAGCTAAAGYSQTPTLRWDAGSVCPCTLAYLVSDEGGCAKAEGYVVMWSAGGSLWKELVKLPCTPAFTDEDGAHARWCWGVDRDVAVSKWVDAQEGVEVYFRVEAMSAAGAKSCTAAALATAVCWPAIKEVGR